MKRKIAFVMTICIFCICFFIDSTISFASELSIIVEKEEYQEITDPYQLLELAIQQQKNNDIEQYNINNEYNDSIEVTQLIERIVYINGIEEKFYATTSFLVLDENDQQVTMSQLLENNSAIDASGTTTQTGGEYNLVVSCTAYWEAKYEGILTYIRCISTKNQVVGNTSGEYWVTKLNCAFKGTNDGWLEEPRIDEIIIDAPIPYFMYTVSNPNTLFYSKDRFFSEIAAGVIIFYNTGKEYQIYIDIKNAL